MSGRRRTRLDVLEDVLGFGVLIPGAILLLVWVVVALLIVAIP